MGFKGSWSRETKLRSSGSPSINIHAKHVRFVCSRLSLGRGILCRRRRRTFCRGSSLIATTSQTCKDSPQTTRALCRRLTRSHAHKHEQCNQSRASHCFK